MCVCVCVSECACTWMQPKKKVGGGEVYGNILGFMHMYNMGAITV